MKDPKKAKWLIGTSGVLLSAVLFSQLETGDQTNAAATNSTSGATLNEQFSKKQQQQMTAREKELVQLDWTNFDVQPVQQVAPLPIQPDRRSQRS